MTVIAIFATLSETSAAVSLPFLDNKEREVYIWFLISFPFYLLFLFFATLNFNYRSLYAPSDFEKGKHFIKVMDNGERSESNAPEMSPQRPVQRPCNTQDPPAEASSQPPLSAQHYVRLPERLKDLYIIDARWMSKNVELSYLIEKIQKEQGKLPHAVVCLTSTESESLLEESAFKHSKPTKKRSSITFCIAYNLSSQGITLMNLNLPTDTQPSAVFEDQPERNSQEGINRN